MIGFTGGARLLLLAFIVKLINVTSLGTPVLTQKVVNRDSKMCTVAIGPSGNTNDY